MKFDTDTARDFLTQARIFFCCDDEDLHDNSAFAQTINLNDAFCWASCDAEYVEDSELPRLAELFWLYGWSGIVYWVAVEKRGGIVPEFLDVRRQIEFVRNEEVIRIEQPSPSKRAYLRREYTIGGE